MDLSLITVQHEGVTKICARKTYNYLYNEKSNYSRWTKKNIENNPRLIENYDWIKYETLDIDDEQNNNNLVNIDEQNKSSLINIDVDGDYTAVINDDEKNTNLKRDYFLSFDATLHLCLLANTQKGHEIRQAIIDKNKNDFIKTKKIAELSTKNQLDKAEIKELKQHRFLINKRLTVLTELVDTQDRDLHLLNTGVDIKAIPRMAMFQLNLFDSNKKQLE